MHLEVAGSRAEGEARSVEVRVHCRQRKRARVKELLTQIARVKVRKGRGGLQPNGVESKERAASWERAD